MPKYQIHYYEPGIKHEEEMFEGSFNDLWDYTKALKQEGYSNVDVNIKDDENRPMNENVYCSYRVCYTKDGHRDEEVLEADSLDNLENQIARFKRKQCSNIMVFQEPDNQFFGDDMESFGYPVAVYNFQPDAFSLEPQNKYEIKVEAPETPHGAKYVDFVGTSDEAKEKDEALHALATFNCGPTPEHVFLHKLGNDFTFLKQHERTIGEYFEEKANIRNELSLNAVEPYTPFVKELCEEIKRTENYEIKSGILDEKNLNLLLQDKDSFVKMVNSSIVSNSEVYDIISRMKSLQVSQQKVIRNSMEKLQSDLRTCKAVVENTSKNAPTDSPDSRINESKAYQFISSIGKTHQELSNNLAKVHSWSFAIQALIKSRLMEFRLFGRFSVRMATPPSFSYLMTSSGMKYHSFLNH